MFSGGQVTTGQVAERVLWAVAQDYCPANQSETVCQAWCPSVDATQVCEIPNPHPALPAWDSLPANLQTMIGDENHLGVGSNGLGYTDAKAAYEALRTGGTVPQPGASTTSAAPAQPTPPPPATTTAQPAAAQQTQTATPPPAESSLPSGHQLRFTFGYNIAPKVSGFQGDELPDTADYYGTGPTQFLGGFVIGINYEYIWANNFFIGGGAQLEVAASQRQEDMSGQSFEDGTVYTIDGHLEAGYRFPLSASIGLKLGVDVLVGYSFVDDNIFLNGLTGPVDYNAFHIGGGAGLDLQFSLSKSIYLELGIHGGGSYAAMDIPGWRAGTSNQVHMPYWYVTLPVTLGWDI